MVDTRHETRDTRLNFFCFFKFLFFFNYSSSFSWFGDRDLLSTSLDRRRRRRRRRMGSNPKLSLMVAAVLSAVAGLAAASSFISDDALVPHGSGGRSLLQATTSCPVNFEFMNYTIITSRCKGPQYPVDQCCGALTDFACPYAVEINDLTNDCAQIMFSYIHLYGNYPPGLFASECRGGKLGISCMASAPQSQISSSTDRQYQSLISLALLLCGSLLGFLLC